MVGIISYNISLLLIPRMLDCYKAIYKLQCKYMSMIIDVSRYENSAYLYIDKLYRVFSDVFLFIFLFLLSFLAAVLSQPGLAWPGLNLQNRFFSFATNKVGNLEMHKIGLLSLDFSIVISPLNIITRYLSIQYSGYINR